MDANTGVNEEYKQMVEKVQTLEREKRGMYEEMKAEREKRQALEAEVGNIRTEIQAVRTQPTPGQDPNLEWITEFAKNGKTVLKREVDEYTKPLREANALLSNALAYREAYEYIAEEEGTTIGKLRKNKVLEDLDRVAKDHNLNSLAPLPRAQAAYEFLKMERKQKEDAEKAQNAAIQGNATQPTGNQPPASGNPRSWKESEIQAMDMATYNRHRNDILIAGAEGRIVADVPKR